MTVVVLVREIGITVLRFVVIRHGVMPAGRGGKVKTVLQALALGLYVLPLAGAWHVAAELVMAAAVVVTVVTGVDYVVRARTLRRTSPRARAKRARRAARLAATGPAAGGCRGGAPSDGGDDARAARRATGRGPGCRSDPAPLDRVGDATGSGGRWTRRTQWTRRPRGQDRRHDPDGPDARLVSGEVQAAAATLVAELTARAATVATAESLTGGLVSAALTGVPGASVVVRGGVVSYSTDVKASVLGVDPELLARAGAVDASVAEQMAAGTRAVLDADYGLATTGVAGPDPAEGKPVGRVFVAVAGPGTSRVQVLDLRGDRASIRAQSVLAVLRLLGEMLDLSVGEEVDRSTG